MFTTSNKTRFHDSARKWSSFFHDGTDTVHQTLVRGVAGGGKSLLILIKIVEIIRRGNGDRAVLIAPDPFIFKCERILKANGLSIDIIKSLPVKPTKTATTNTATATTTTNTATATASTTTPPDVLIMHLRDFFQVPTTTLQQYDIDPYHVFIDDLQSYFVSAKRKDDVRYSEIAMFIDDLYMKRIHTPLYLWVCFDVLQSADVIFDDHHITSLTHITVSQPRPLNIPEFNLTKILRNSADIIPIIQKTRSEIITTRPQELSALNTLGNVTGGHNITCTPVVYHELLKNTEEKHRKSFITHVLAEVLPQVVDMVASISPSDVAILYEKDDNIDKTALQQLVSTNFHCKTQTINDFAHHDNKDDVILDNVFKVSSFEFQVVVFVVTSEYGDGSIHNMMTRARSHLVMVNANPSSKTNNLTNLTSSDDVHRTIWRHDKKSGQFVRCVDNPTPVKRCCCIL